MIGALIIGGLVWLTGSLMLACAAAIDAPERPGLRGVRA